MAYLNTKKRQTFIADLIHEKGALSSSEKKEAAIKFKCSIGAIYADISLACRPKTEKSVYITKKMRNFILTRDDFLCQYCLNPDSQDLIIEHVIPVFYGGVAQPYNLVVACHTCNMKKGRSIWVPKNFYKITENNLLWREKVLNLSKSVQPHK